jgi:hypothetical protein
MTFKKSLRMPIINRTIKAQAILEYLLLFLVIVSLTLFSVNLLPNILTKIRQESQAFFIRAVDRVRE